jgi:hypothetical protein
VAIGSLYRTKVGSGLPPEDRALLGEAEHYRKVYDEDCLTRTPEQLAPFRLVNDQAEHACLMLETGIVDYKAG